MHKRAHVYVIMLHEATGRWYALNRNYGLLRGIQGNREDFVRLTDHHGLGDNGKAYMVSRWAGWVPSDKAQIPEWAQRSKAEGWVARWYIGTEADPKREWGFEVEARPQAEGYGVTFEQVQA